MGASTLGGVGPKGCFYWGLTNVPENLEMSQPINVISFSFKKQIFIGVWLSMDHSKDNLKKIIMSFSNLTTFFFNFLLTSLITISHLS